MKTTEHQPASPLNQAPCSATVCGWDVTPQGCVVMQIARMQGKSPQILQQKPYWPGCPAMLLAVTVPIVRRVLVREIRGFASHCGDYTAYVPVRPKDGFRAGDYCDGPYGLTVCVEDTQEDHAVAISSYRNNGDLGRKAEWPWVAGRLNGRAD